LASRGFQSVLALEVETSWWPTNCTSGHTQAYPRIANPLWGAPRIHGELLKLGIEIGQTSVRAVERTGHILCRLVLGGLHHHYTQI
jgi:hypothetical protein